MSEKIKFDKRNYRKHNDKNKNLINKSLKECGAGRSIVIDNENEIIAGNGIYEQAQKLNIPTKIIETDGTELVVVKRTDLNTNDEKRKQLAIMDNSTSDSSEFDLESLQADFDVEQLQDWGLDVEFENLEEQEIIEDEVPEEVETKCKLGDIWQLGNHRLMCGDSTSITDVEKLMDGAKADMVFTDPPYGMLKENKGVKNDSLDSIHQRDKKSLLEFNKKWIPLSINALKDNGSWYCWGIDEPLMDIYYCILKPYILNVKLTFRNLITWDKGIAQGQNSNLFRMYPVASEKCLFCQCGFQEGFNNNGDDYDYRFEAIRKYIEDECIKCGINEAKKFNSVLGATNKYQHLVTKSHWYLITEKDYLTLRSYAKDLGINAFDLPYNELKQKYNSLWAYFDNTHDNMNDVWHFPRTSQDERKQTGGHATPKPIALCARAINSSCRINEAVLDLFGGSGSTLIACEQLDRKCYMMELDPHYCDVILQRWENLTGKKAVLLNGEQREFKTLRQQSKPRRSQEERKERR